MLCLGIDTSSKTASIGVADDDGLFAELTLHAGSNHSERLLASVHALLEAAGLRPDQIDLFAVSAGPGSFTGLRIGMATSKGLALALGRPLVGFSTLETIAMAVASRLPGHLLEGRALCILIDAGRGEVYRGTYRCDQGRPISLSAEAVLAVDRAMADPPEAMVVCDDDPLFRDRIVSLALRGGSVVAPAAPIGAALARRGLELAANCGLDRLPPLVPNYLRPSDAEMTFKG